MIERPIGSIFYDPKYGKLQVIEGDKSCKGCVYADSEGKVIKCSTLPGFCREILRTDNKNVIFKPL